MPSAATWMDLAIVILSEVSQTEKDKYHMISPTCGVFKKGTNELICKSEIEVQMQKTNLWLAAGRGGEINWEVGMDIYRLLYIKQITNKNLLYSTENSTQYSAMAYMGKEFKTKIHMYTYN